MIALDLRRIYFRSWAIGDCICSRSGHYRSDSDRSNDKYGSQEVTVVRPQCVYCQQRTYVC